MTSIELRQPTLSEIGEIHATETEYHLATANGQPVAWIAFREIDGRVWGMFGTLGERSPEVWRRVFWAFRDPLRKQGRQVVVLARDQAAERLLRVLGFERTNEVHSGKEIWRWKPQH